MPDIKNTELKKLENIAKTALLLAQKNGSDEAEVMCEVNEGYTVSVRNNDVENVEYHNDYAVGVTVYFGKKKGSATITGLSSDSLEKAVNSSCQIAKFIEADPYSGLAEKELMATNTPDLDLFYDFDIDSEKAIEHCLAAESYALNLDKRIKQTESIGFVKSKSFAVYANSHGFVGVDSATQYERFGGFIAEAGESKERDSAFSVAIDINDLESFEQICDRAVKKTVDRLRAKKLSTQTLPVLFTPEIARSLIGNFLRLIDGNRLYRKTSFLVDQLNQQVFSDCINIYEDPFLPKMLGSAAFDSEGVATSKKYFVENGVLTNYILDGYSARRLSMKTTGNADGAHNLFVKPEDKNLDQLMKTMGTGLMVTELFGQGVNMLTGDYSRGAFGFFVKNGEIQYPVSEITVAGNLKDMFKKIIAVGNDIDRYGNIQTGSILIESMTIAGT